MPVLNGYEATKAIRALPGGKQIKIAALTASAFREDKDAILSAGCDDMLAKPVDEQRLFRVMGDLLGIHYRYADEEQETTEKQPALDSSLDLSPLSPELCSELKHAAELLDTEHIEAIIDCIRTDHPEIAKAITVWTNVYRFDVIAKLCHSCEKQAQ